MPCHNCGACDKCEKCTHCQKCKNCGKDIIQEPYPYVPYIPKYPIYPQPWYPVIGPTWTTPSTITVTGIQYGRNLGTSTYQSGS